LNTLWTFGDSFTFGHGCRPDCNSGIYDRYKSYKDNEDDIWVNKVSKELNLTLNNLGVNGYDNNSIIDSIIDSYNSIQEGDIVIIGKTAPSRNKIPIGDNNYTIIGPSELENPNKELSEYLKDFDNDISQTIINFQYHFSGHPYYKRQQDKRFSFLVERLYSEKKIEKCIVWDETIRKKFEIITQDTKGEIIDYHFSWKGHNDFSKYIYSQINPTAL
jgi:hypothetical protein